ncbi:hypothetical protein LWI28_014969 [Acer negundo]|uniref:Uncharacterized protein n=1 Tax=Acer negundo TaxID=4023 RepID=A0AAD5P0Q2_ACENE|nr:hypothetical protein LWI28_014969 [Acer negundo]
MDELNAQLGHMGLPLVANQHQRELPHVAIPDQEDKSGNWKQNLHAFFFPGKFKFSLETVRVLMIID